jgi:hypothetical protein
MTARNGSKSVGSLLMDGVVAEVLPSINSTSLQRISLRPLKRRTADVTSILLLHVWEVRGWRIFMRHNLALISTSNLLGQRSQHAVRDPAGLRANLDRRLWTLSGSDPHQMSAKQTTSRAKTDYLCSSSSAQHCRRFMSKALQLR